MSAPDEPKAPNYECIDPLNQHARLKEVAPGTHVYLCGIAPLLRPGALAWTADYAMTLRVIEHMPGKGTLVLKVSPEARRPASYEDVLPLPTPDSMVFDPEKDSVNLETMPPGGRTWLSNLTSAKEGIAYVIPGERQGYLVRIINHHPTKGTLVEFIERLPYRWQTPPTEDGQERREDNTRLLQALVELKLGTPPGERLTHLITVTQAEGGAYKATLSPLIHEGKSLESSSATGKSYQDALRRLVEQAVLGYPLLKTALEPKPPKINSTQEVLGELQHGLSLLFEQYNRLAERVHEIQTKSAQLADQASAHLEAMTSKEEINRE